MTESAGHVEEDEGHALIYAAMSSVMRAIGAIGKGQTNQFDKYKFRGIDDVYNALQPALVEAGVIVVPSLQTMERTNFEAKSGATQQHVTVEVLFEFFARDGSRVAAVYPGEGQDRGDKAISKAMSGAYKAAMFGVFCIPTESLSTDSETDSPDGANIPPKPKRKAAPRKPSAAETALGAQPETKPDRKAANPISEAQAQKSVAECIERGKAWPIDGKPMHGFHLLNSVLKAAGIRTAEKQPGSGKQPTKTDVYLHLCERIDRSEFDDFLELVRAWEPSAEDF